MSNEPVPIGPLLDSLRRDLDVPAVSVDGRLAAAWQHVAGPAGDHSEVRSLRGGTLTVVADGPAWASRLRHQERQLLEELSARLGELSAHRLRVVVGS